MEPRSKRWLYWSPRILAVAYAAFLGLFAADVFGESTGFWETTLALLIHLVPTCIVLIALAVAWRWELAGAILFFVLGLSYIVWAWDRFPLANYLVMAGPLFLVGVLFLLHSSKARTPRT